MDKINKYKGQLRYYISLSAPPSRAPLDFEPDYIRPEVGFNPSWFKKYCDIDFSQKWHEDIEYRYSTHLKMRKEVEKRFSGFNIGVHIDNTPDLLTGLYGTVLPVLFFGYKIRYFDYQWPVAEGQYLTEEQITKLKPVNLENDRYFAKVMAQLDEIEKLTGTVKGFINWQGVLNTAFRLRGEKVLMDLVDDPTVAEHLFECIAITMIQGKKLLYQRQSKSGLDYDFGNIGNCTVNMVGPELYEKHVFPYDRMIRKEFRDFAIHNCAWTVDPYMEIYSQVEGLGYLDMGFDTDFEKAKKLFPNTRRNILYTSKDLLNKSYDEIETDVLKIAKYLAPCDLGLPDIEDNVPDEKILFVLNLCKNISQQSGELV